MHKKTMVYFICICILITPVQIPAESYPETTPVKAASTEALSDVTSSQSDIVRENIGDSDLDIKSTQEFNSEQAFENYKSKFSEYVDDRFHNFHQLLKVDKEQFFTSLDEKEQYLFLRLYCFYFNRDAEELSAQLDKDPYCNTNEAATEQLESALLYYLDTLISFQSISKTLISSDFPDLDKIAGKMLEQQEMSQTSMVWDDLSYKVYLYMFSENKEDIKNPSILEQHLLIPLTQYHLLKVTEKEVETSKLSFENLFKNQESADGPVASTADLMQSTLPSPSNSIDNNQIFVDELTKDSIPYNDSLRSRYQVGWNSDSEGWWYSTDGTNYYKNTWAWLPYHNMWDYYYFNESGYMAVNQWLGNNFVNENGYCTVTGAKNADDIDKAFLSGHCSAIRLLDNIQTSPDDVYNSYHNMRMESVNGTKQLLANSSSHSLIHVMEGTLTICNGVVLNGNNMSKNVLEVSYNAVIEVFGEILGSYNRDEPNGAGNAGHGIRGDNGSTIKVQDGANIHNNAHAGVGSFGNIIINGGSIHDNARNGVHLNGTLGNCNVTVNGGRIFCNGDIGIVLLGGSRASGNLNTGYVYGNGLYDVQILDSTKCNIGNYYIGISDWTNDSSYTPRSSGSVGLYIDNGSSCSFTSIGGRIFNSRSQGIQNYGNLTVNSSGSTRILGRATEGIHNAGIATLKNTEVYQAECGIYNSGTLYFQSGNINGCNNRGVLNDGALYLSGGSIFNNTTSNYGGGICNNGTLTISGGKIFSNSSTWGGGIQNMPGKNVIIKDCDIYANQAAFGGGCINNDGFLSISGGTFHGNRSDSAGAGIRNGSVSSIITLSGGYIYGNTDGGYGLYISAGELNIEKSPYLGFRSYDNWVSNIPDADNAGEIYIAEGAKCNFMGGGYSRIYSDQTYGIYNAGACNVIDTGVKNHTEVYGSSEYGFYNTGTANLNLGFNIISPKMITRCGLFNNGNAVLNGTIISNNNNRGILNSGGTLTMYKGSVHNNASDAGGGGIYVDKDGTLLLSGGDITSNRANGSSGCGGGLYIAGKCDMTGGKIYANTAKGKGGGIYLQPRQYWDGTTCPASLSIHGGIIENNSAVWGGGILMDSDSDCTIAGSKIINNKAQLGNGLYLDSHLLVSENPTVRGDIFLAPNRYLLVEGKIQEFTCAMNEEDTFNGRVLAHYVKAYLGEFSKYSLNETTTNYAKKSSLEIQEGELKDSGYPYSIYLSGGKKCKINYFSNKGNGYMESDIVPITENYILKENIFTYDQHAFAGWDFDPQKKAGNAQFQSGDSVDLHALLEKEIQKTGKKNSYDIELNLYAIWDDPPEIASGANEFFEGEKVSKEQLINGIIKGFDPEDGPITENIRIVKISYSAAESGYCGRDIEFQDVMPDDYQLDTYGGKGMVKGEKVTHTISFYLKDSAGNETIQEENIYVNYNNPPSMLTPEVITLSVQDTVNGTLNEDMLICYVKAKDPEDDLAKTLELKNDRDELIDIQKSVKILNIKNEEGTGIDVKSINQPGRYQVTFQASDRFGKSTEKIVPLHIYDENDNRSAICSLRFITLSFLDTLSDDSQWTREELMNKLSDNEPKTIIDLSHDMIKDIQNKMQEYGKNKETTEQILHQVTDAYIIN